MTKHKLTLIVLGLALFGFGWTLNRRDLSIEVEKAFAAGSCNLRIDRTYVYSATGTCPSDGGQPSVMTGIDVANNKMWCGSPRVVCN